MRKFCTIPADRTGTTNGLAERKIRQVREYIRSYEKEAEDLEELMAACQFAINTAVSQPTGQSPFFLNHMREPRSRMENILESEAEPEPTKKLLKKSAEDIEEMRKTQKEVRDRVGQAQKLLREKERAKYGNLKYRRGDLVVLNKSQDTRTVEDK